VRAAVARLSCVLLLRARTLVAQSEGAQA